MAIALPIGTHGLDVVPSPCVVYILIDFEFIMAIDRHLHPEAAEFIIHLDSVGLHFKFDSPSLRMFAVIGGCFSQKLCIKFLSEEGKDIGTFEVV